MESLPLNPYFFKAAAINISLEKKKAPFFPVLQDKIWAVQHISENTQECFSTYLDID